MVKFDFRVGGVVSSSTSKKTFSWYEFTSMALFVITSAFVINDKFFGNDDEKNQKKKNTTFFMVKNEDMEEGSSMVNINIFGGGAKPKKTMTQRFREFMNKVDENSDIQIVIKTLGGSYTENKMMTDWIRQHKGKVTVIVPEYAFSSGSFVAFYADEIIMHKRAHLSPVDPQLSLPLVGALSYTDIMRVAEQCNNPSEPMQLLNQTVNSMKTYMDECLYDTENFLKPSLIDPTRRDEFFRKLTEDYTHYTPLSVENLRDFGLNVTAWDEIPKDMQKKYQKAMK